MVARQRGEEVVEEEDEARKTSELSKNTPAARRTSAIILTEETVGKISRGWNWEESTQAGADSAMARSAEEEPAREAHQQNQH